MCSLFPLLTLLGHFQTLEEGTDKRVIHECGITQALLLVCNHGVTHVYIYNKNNV